MISTFSRGPESSGVSSPTQPLRSIPLPRVKHTNSAALTMLDSFLNALELTGYEQGQIRQSSLLERIQMMCENCKTCPTVEPNIAQSLHLRLRPSSREGLTEARADLNNPHEEKTYFEGLARQRLR